MSESPKSILNDLEFGLDRLRESLEELIETVNREQRQATKEGFAVLLNHGFNVGVSFLLKDCKTVWKITGICSFRICRIISKRRGNKNIRNRS